MFNLEIDPYSSILVTLCKIASHTELGKPRNLFEDANSYDYNGMKISLSLMLQSRYRTGFSGVLSGGAEPARVPGSAACYGRGLRGGLTNARLYVIIVKLNY